jgi:hypothetical protein
MPQLQKAIPAAAPFKKFLRVVIHSLRQKYKLAFSHQRPIDLAGLFLISSPRTLPSRKR